MKGIYYQVREGKISNINEFTKEDKDKLKIILQESVEKDIKYRKNRLKELKDNEKHLIKKSKELNKEIPFELAYHCFLNFNKTYVGSSFIEKYKEWF